MHDAINPIKTNTIIDVGSGETYTDIQSALDSLKNVFIDAGVVVTLQLKDEVYPISSSIVVDHPQGSQIEIVGLTKVAKTLSSIQGAPGGAAGNWSVVLNLNDVSDITTSHFAFIDYNDVSGGTDPDLLKGVWPITNVDGPNNRITINTTTQYATAPSGAVAGNVYILKSVIDVAGVDGIELTSSYNQLKTLSNLVLDGRDATGNKGIDLTESRVYLS